MKLRQLTTNRPTRDLRWTRDGERSLRAYAIDADDDPCPCVSTRSGELNIVLEGDVVIEVGPKKQEVRIRAGEACLVPRGQPHTVRVERGGRVLMVDVRGVAAEEGLRFVPARILPSAPLHTIDRAWRKDARAVFAGAWDAAEEVTTRTAELTPIRIEHTAQSARMLRVKATLEKRFVDPPSLAELGALARLNEFYLLREFKRQFAFSPYAYAQFLRVEHFVWELLGARSPRTLLRLSAEAGFGDYSTFQKRMREATGRSPSDLVDDEATGTLGP